MSDKLEVGVKFVWLKHGVHVDRQNSDASITKRLTVRSSNPLKPAGSLKARYFGTDDTNSIHTVRLDAEVEFKLVSAVVAEPKFSFFKSTDPNEPRSWSTQEAAMNFSRDSAEWKRWSAGADYTLVQTGMYQILDKD